jgi:hypothetical protein
LDLRPGTGWASVVALSYTNPLSEFLMGESLLNLLYLDLEACLKVLAGIADTHIPLTKK